MKIGILTLKYNSNYGGILQMLALCKFLDEHDVEIINFERSKKKSKLDFLIRLSRILSFKSLFFKYRNAKSKNQLRKKLTKEFSIKMNSFLESNFQFSEKVDETNIHMLVSKYDAVIIGSDQVWANVYNRDLTYFTGSFSDYKGIKIAFSACKPTLDIPLLNKLRLKKLLKNFDAISVRDNQTAQFVEGIIKTNPKITSDPTLLYDFPNFVDKQYVEAPYVLVYILGDIIPGDFRKLKNKIIEKYGEIKIISVLISDVSCEAENISDLSLYNIDPKEWLNLIYHAKFIITDSFHGTLFSIKYRKQFISYYSQISRSSRLLDLQNRFNIKNIVSSVDECLEKQIIENDIDYSLIEKSINHYNKISTEYLHNILNKHERYNSDI